MSQFGRDVQDLVRSQGLTMLATLQGAEESRSVRCTVQPSRPQVPHTPRSLVHYLCVPLPKDEAAGLGVLLRARLQPR